MQLPVLVLAGMKDGSDAGDRYRTPLPASHFTFAMMQVAPSAPSGRRRSPTSRSNSSSGAISSASAGKAAWPFP